MPVKGPDWLGPLYDGHAASMYSYALALLGNAEEAEDTVQDVFVNICSAATPPDNPRHYLLRSVRNQAITRIRKRRLRFWKRPQLPNPAPMFDRPHQLPHEDLDRLQAEICSLPADQREVLLLKTYEGMTFEDIASLTGVSANTAASRYRYAIDKLRQRFAKEPAL